MASVLPTAADCCTPCDCPEVTNIPGSPGTGATAVEEPPGLNCANGGVKITDGEGNVTYVCNGEDGANGTNGTNGTNGVGTPGADGSDGINAYTVTTANFTQPAEGATINVEVASSVWIAMGQHLYVTGGGDYEVTALPDPTHVTIKNLEDTATGMYPGNAAPAAVIGAGAAVSPGGIQGPVGATPTGAQNVVAITEEMAAGVAPAAMVFAAPGTWTQKTLNTLYDPDGVATLVANQFTLPDGRWIVNAGFCADKCKIRIRLFDVTNNVMLLISLNDVTAASGMAVMFGAIDLSGTPTLQVDYQAVDNGGGVFGASTGIPTELEAYSSLLFTRINFP